MFAGHLRRFRRRHPCSGYFVVLGALLGLLYTSPGVAQQQCPSVPPQSVPAALPAQACPDDPSQSFPGCSNPLTYPPSRLTLFRDDEVALLSFNRDNTGYDTGTFLPNPDFTLTTGAAFTVPNTPQSVVENPFDQHAVGAGRFVDPSRDALLILSKRSAVQNSNGTWTITWDLGEVAYSGGTPPSTGVPSHSFSTTVGNLGHDDSTPGAIATGDLDRAVDSNGDYHDEVALVFETPNQQLTLQIIDYSVVPGQATVNASATQLGALAYVTDIGNVQPSNFPGSLDITIGDFDGDGINEVAVGAFIQTTTSTELKVFLYRYAPTGGPNGTGTLTAMGPPVVLTSALHHSPLELDHGDVDGDGDEEVIVAYHENFNLSSAPKSVDLHIGIVDWDATAEALTFAFIDEVGQGAEAWQNYDPGSDEELTRQNDFRIAAGLFKYAPLEGYPLSRRQVAVARHSGNGQMTVDILDFASPKTPQLPTPAPPPPSTWMVNQLTSGSTSYCYDTNVSIIHGIRNGFTLAAGNWAGVKANPPDPLWGIAVGYETSDHMAVRIGHIDANGQLQFNDSAEISKVGGDCAHHNRNAVVAFDFDGDSLQLGAPVHMVVENAFVIDYVLQEPPKHIDYLPNDPRADASTGIYILSKFTNFNWSYTDASGTTFSTTNTKNTTWNTGGSVAATAKFTQSEGIPDAISVNTSESITVQAGYDHTDNESNYIGQQQSCTLALQAVTSNDDAVSYSARTFDVWRYRIYGPPSVTLPDGTTGNTYYEVTLPRALESSAAIGGSSWDAYQPLHENGNILSYPVNDTSDATQFSPIDIGPWRPPGSDTPITAPLAPPKKGAWDGSQNNMTLDLESSQSQGQSRDITNAFTSSLDVKFGVKVKYGVPDEGGTADLSLDTNFHGGATWEHMSTSSSTTSETQQLLLSNISGDLSRGYFFYPIMYMDQTGALKVAHAVGLDHPQGQSWWDPTYGTPDPALNLPFKFYLDSANFITPTWELNADISAKQMRGFFLTSPALNPVTNDYLYLASMPTVGDKVRLEARIYNYTTLCDSPAPPQPPPSSCLKNLSNVQVRFDLVAVDETNQDIGTRTILGTVTAQCANLSGMESTQCPDSTSIPPRGTGIASLVIDTSDLGPSASSASQAYRVYVIVDPDGIYNRPLGNPLGAPHNWYWQDVTITPLNYTTPGIKLAFEVQNAQGTITTISYTSQGTLEDVVNGLITAVNTNQILQPYGVQATAGSSGTYLTLFFTNRTAVLKPATEFRAALFDNQGTQLYFVPQTQQGATIPTLAASNDERGQNNEGWGLITVFAKEAISDPGSPTAVDLSLSGQSLAAVHANATVATGWVRGYTDQQLPVRITAFADRHSRPIEHVQLFLGHPDHGGELLAAKQILGVDASQGSHAWHTWVTPTKPGVYRLYARLRERPGDPQPGNNLAMLRVIVLPRWFARVGQSAGGGASQ